MLFILIGSRSVETESCRLTKFGFSWKRNGQDGGRFSCSFLIGDWLLRHFSVQSTAGNDVGCPRLWSRRRREDDERNLRWFFCFLFFFCNETDKMAAASLFHRRRSPAKWFTTFGREIAANIEWMAVETAPPHPPPCWSMSAAVSASSFEIYRRNKLRLGFFCLPPIRGA